MKRLAVSLALLLIFAGALLAGLYIMLSPAFLTVEIAKAVTQSTGKVLTFSESPRLKIWPEPGVIFHGVRLSSPGGENGEPFAEIEQMAVKIGAKALFDRRVAIEEIRLFNPKLNLVVDRDGRSSWTMSPAAKGSDKATTGSSQNTLALPPIYAEGGTVTFSDERSGQRFSLERLDLVLMLASLEGPVDVKGSADWQSDRVSFSLFIKSPQLLASKGSPLDLNVSGSWLNFAFNGWGAVSKEFDLAGTVAGRTRSMRGLMRWAGFDVGEGKGLGSFHASGALSLKGKSLNIAKAQFILDGMKAQGEVSLGFGAGRPKISARLGIDQIDLNRYFMASAGPSAEAEEGIESWSSEAVQLSLLNSIDAKAVLRAARLTYGRASMSNAVIDTTVGGGILNAKLNQIEMFGGSGQGQIVLNGAQKVPTVQASFQGQGFNGHRLFRDLWNFDRLEGQTEFAFTLAATGRSQREMIASLGGTAGFKISDGAVRGVNLGNMVESVAQKILVGWMQDRETTKFQLLKANFKLSDGIAETRDFELAGPSVRFKGSGLADLLKCEVDFKIDPDVVTDGTAAGFAFAVPVVVKGPWAKPKFYPDIAGVLENPQAAYDTLKMLVGKASMEKFNDGGGKGENAGGVAGEVLSNQGDQGAPAQAVDLIKKEFHKNTLELMNGFASESPPEPAASEP